MFRHHRRNAQLEQHTRAIQSKAKTKALFFAWWHAGLFCILLNSNKETLQLTWNIVELFHAYFLTQEGEGGRGGSMVFNPSNVGTYHVLPGSALPRAMYCPAQALFCYAMPGPSLSCHALPCAALPFALSHVLFSTLSCPAPRGHILSV